MSAKKAKTAPKQKPANLREARKSKPKLVGHGGGPEGPTGRFWTQWIEPRGAALLSENLTRCLFVIKNHGSDNVMLFVEHGGQMDLPPGKVRATYSYGSVRVENWGEKWVLIEFEFLPIYMMK